jgi:hypothetical protein
MNAAHIRNIYAAHPNVVSHPMRDWMNNSFTTRAPSPSGVAGAEVSIGLRAVLQGALAGMI